MSKQIISPLQFAWLIGSLFFTISMIALPQQVARIAGGDFWVSLVIPTIYALLVGYFFYRLSLAFPGKHIFEIIRTLAGSFGGSLINAAILLYFWLIFIRDLSVLTSFLNTALLPNTPTDILKILFMVLVIYYGKSSLEVTARVNSIWFPFLILLFLLQPLMLANDFSYNQLLPLLTEPIAHIGSANMISLTWYGDILIIGAFLHMLHTSKQIHAAIRHGVILSIFILTLVFLLCITVMGANIIANLSFPTYSLIEQIHITEFMDRLELVLLSVYFPVYATNMFFIYLAILIGINDFARDSDYTKYSKITGLFVFLTSAVAFDTTTQVMNFSNYGLLVVMLAIQPALFLLLFVIKWIRKIDNKSAGSSPSSANEEHDKTQQTQNNKQMKQAQQTITSKPQNIPWTKITYLSLAFSLISLAVGYITALNFQWAAQVCSVFFGLGLVTAVCSSYMEAFHSAKIQA